MVSALASGARDTGFDPRGMRGKGLVSEHASRCVICRYDMSTVCRSSDQDINWRSQMQGHLSRAN